MAGVPGARRIVPAAERFRALFADRPWRRRRRQITLGVLLALVLLVVAGGVLLWLPALRVSQVEVEGLGYVDESAVRSAVAGDMDRSMLLARPAESAEAVEEVPGVRTAEVEREWPSTLRVSVTEREAVAQLTGPEGGTTYLDETGAELPAAAAEGATLMPMTIAPDAADPTAAAEAMAQVLPEIPADLRGSVTQMTATSRSDVTFTLATEDSGEISVVWGGAEDAQLKAEVLPVLIGQGPSVIDVSSPVAPVTR